MAMGILGVVTRIILWKLYAAKPVAAKLELLFATNTKEEMRVRN